MVARAVLRWPSIEAVQRPPRCGLSRPRVCSIGIAAADGPGYHGPVIEPRLAILTTFEGELPFTARHPDDGAKVAAGLAPHLRGWAFDTWRVSEGRWPSDPAAYAGFVVTGSPASVNDDSPWIRRLEALVRQLHARRTPMVGLCFGHQVIAKALGGAVGLSPGGWRVGTAPLPLQSPPAWLADAPPQLCLNAVA